MSFPAQVWMDVKMLFRIPVSVFFSIAFPPLMLVIMMTSFGNFAIGDGLHFSDKYLMISIGMGLVPLAFVTFSAWISSSYESSYLTRLRYFHVPLRRVAASGAVAHVVVALCGVAVSILVGVVFYQVSSPSVGYFLMFLAEAVVVLLALMAFGCAIGFVVRQMSAALGLGLILMFLVYMLCGAFGNYDGLPDGLKNISDWIPLKYLMIDGFDVWRGASGFDVHLLLISIIWIVVFGAVSALAARRGPHIVRRHPRSTEVNDELEANEAF